MIGTIMYNSLVLAYVGDSVYELYIRQYLIEQNITKVKELQKEAVKYVSAKGQAYALQSMLDSEFLTNQEQDIVRQARNHKSHGHPKNTDILTYKHATGLEALIGYLYINKKIERLDEIMNYIKEVIC